MLIPYKSDHQLKHFPIMTLILIIVNFLVYYYQAIDSNNYDEIINKFGFNPCYISYYHYYSFYTFISIITYMFLHYNLFHVSLNMLFLWVFGNNIEDTLGIFRFYSYYIICGLGAIFAFYLTHEFDCRFVVGSSGAISGLLAGYLILYPGSKIKIWFLFFRIQLKAWLFILLWLLYQIFNCFYYESSMSNQVAWSAHLGGFITGLVVIFFYKRRL